MARKLYSYPPNRQNGSISGYVGNNRGDIDDYLNANAERILAEKRAARERGERYHGHGMNWADGRLHSDFKKSLGKAMSGGRVNKEKKRLSRLGKPSSVNKIRKNFKDMHKVKFGVDPYHS